MLDDSVNRKTKKEVGEGGGGGNVFRDKNENDRNNIV